MAQHYRVEPADPPGPARGGAIFPASLADAVAGGVLQLGGKRSRTDAGRVSLHDAEHGTDPLRTYAGADGGTGRNGRRRSDVRVGAVIDVEQGALGAFEDDP